MTDGHLTILYVFRHPDTKNSFNANALQLKILKIKSNISQNTLDPLFEKMWGGGIEIVKLIIFLPKKGLN